MIFVRVVMLPVLLLLLVCAAIVFYFVSYSGKRVETNLERVAVDHRDMIDSFFREKSSVLKLIISTNSYEQLKNKNKINELFSNLQVQSRAFIDIGVFDAEGNHVAYAGPYDLQGKSYLNTEWFERVKQNGFFISDEFMGFRQSPHFIIAVKKIENGVPWYLRATIDTNFFNNLVESIRIGRTGRAYILNKKGILQAMRTYSKNDLTMYKIKNGAMENQSVPVTFFSGGLFNTRYIHSAIPLSENKWTLVVRQETMDAYFPLFMAALISVLIILIGGAAVVVTGFAMASNMANRLRIADVEKREMKTQLIIAGKLAEVGEMSTGIAHEINNPLQIIKSEIAMIEDSIDEIENSIDEKNSEQIETLKDSSDQIKIQVDRCSGITRGLLNFARKTEGIFEKFRLQKIIPEIVHMVDEKARVENIKIIQEIQEDLPEMTSDSGQLQQVFLNLLNNSIYALKGKKNAEIRINAKQNNSNIEISVADNGCGFTKEEMEKAFIPFFTTKPVGEGTGLGLSTVYGIIKGLGGDLTLKSEYNEGSIFKVTLPFNSSEIKKEN